LVIQAWEIISWLASCFERSVDLSRVEPGREIAWRFAAPHGDVRVCARRLEKGPPSVTRVRIACQLGGTPGR
jgi:hypothetical protein